MASDGEGSRGGKVIGHTRSGKPIYDSREHNNHLEGVHDHNDASRAHDEQTLKDPSRADHHRKQAEIHRFDSDHAFARSEGYKDSIEHRKATGGPTWNKAGKQMALDAARRASRR